MAFVYKSFIPNQSSFCGLIGTCLYTPYIYSLYSAIYISLTRLVDILIELSSELAS